MKAALRWNEPALGLDQDAAVLAECRAVLEHGSKSFALATRLLGPRTRDSATAVYAYCRRVDDAIDGCPPADQERALARLERELTAIYRGDVLGEADQRAFQAVVRRHAVPELYPRELIAGMAMDVRGVQYESLEDLLLYCYRVAGVVGLMMCHVFGLTREDVLRHARDLGIAMQLTNICRDVVEDHGLGRVYLPRALLVAAACPALLALDADVPWSDARTRRAVSQVVRQLLAEADGYYHSAELGIRALPFRAGFAVRVAARLYRAIGTELVSRGCDVSQGRVVLGPLAKARLVLSAVFEHLAALLTKSQER